MISDDQIRATWPSKALEPQVMHVESSDAHKSDPARFWLAPQACLHNGRLLVSFSVPAVSGSIRFAELLEAQRQAGLAYVHQVLGVPKNHVFVLDSIRLSCERLGLGRALELQTGDVDVELINADGQGSRTRRAALAFTLRANNATIGRGAADVRLVPAAVYERIRRRLPIAEPQGSAERDDPHHKVYCQRFFVDQDDPILTDHSSDHITAMSIVCAVERLIRSELHSSHLNELSLRFHSYAEPDASSEIEFRCLGDGVFVGKLAQNGATPAVFSGKCSSGLPNLLDPS